MARVYLDVNVFSQPWFKTILAELLRSKNVIFVFSQSEKMMREIAKVHQALRLYKTAASLKGANNECRVIEAPADEVEKHQNIIEFDGRYKKCSDCDDAHVFALIYVKPTPYVFSEDARMAKCRTEINKSVDSRYCDFCVVSNATVYDRHRHKILA